MKVILIDNAKDWYRFAVTWVQGLGASFFSAWLLLSEEQKNAILQMVGITPERLVAFGGLVLIVATMTARLTKQPALHDKSEQ